MSILTKYSEAFINKDEAAMNEILHDDYKFTMHASGNVLSKQDVISWAMSDDINREKVRIIYENDEIGIEHSFVTFNDGNTQAVMAVFTFKDGKILSLETGATKYAQINYYSKQVIKITCFFYEFYHHYINNQKNSEFIMEFQWPFHF